MNEQTELLREMRDLLLAIAEPALAKRDERLRDALHELVGRSEPKAKAALLMDGSRSQATITIEAGIDPGALSRFVKAMRGKSLLSKDDTKKPKLVIAVPSNFFDLKETQ